MTNKTGDTLPNAELCATVNDIYADECVNDRQCFIAFKNWGEMSAEEIARRTERVRFFDFNLPNMRPA